MMKSTYLLAAALLAWNVSEAQELKGPKAKNSKAWEEPGRTGAVLVTIAEPTSKGPSFKNKKAWTSQAEKIEVGQQTATKDRITGPKAKNRKPWKKK